MVYRFLFYFANIILRVYYRKIYTHGIETIPVDKPLLIVSNHPNGFLEPIMMACLFPIDLHFLVRGDLFENKALKWLLTSTNQVPIYRFRDGIAALRNNQKTIAKTIEVLNQNQAIIIFPEGSTDGRWQLRPFKKGMARMAFQCLDESPNLDLHILPVGVVFSKSESPGSEVILRVGKAFAVKDFYSNDAKESKDKMDELTSFAERQVKELMIHLEDVTNENIVRAEWKNFSINNGGYRFLPRKIRDNGIFLHLKSTAAKLNSNTYAQTKPQAYEPGILSYLSFIPSLPGMVFYLPAIYTGKWIQNHFIKQREFVSSVRASITGFLILIFTLLTLLICSIGLGFLKAFMVIVLLNISGLFALMAWEKVINK